MPIGEKDLALAPGSAGDAPGAASESKLLPTRQVRLAVVMYGGSSLSIYINGVAQELLHLVRATAPASLDPDETTPLLADDELCETERVYRRLAQLNGDEPVGNRFPRFANGGPGVDPWADDPNSILARFIVDIISGTSAGGINGIYLAKALATNGSLDSLKQLWVREGDIGLLINDKSSAKGLPGVRAEDPPTSLLNGHRMYYRLLQAFEGMDPAPPAVPLPDVGEEVVTSPLVDQLDLFVTATDFSGLVLPIELADKVIAEPRHRNVYHFIYATEQASGDPRNDFVSKFNPFLAFAARCTSSLPFVFQPMTLESIDPIVRTFPRFQRDDAALARSDRWGRFLSDYVRPGTSPSDLDDFAGRAFGDGGALDNKPFSYAIDAMLRRRADLPVDRKLLYVEPDPADYAFGQPAGPAPDAIGNILQQVVVLPRTEMIREDLQRVLEHNRQTERVRRVLGPLEEDAAALRPADSNAPIIQIDDDAVRGRYLGDLITRYGCVVYGTYQRLRVAEVTDDIARLLCRLADLNEDSDDFFAIRYLVRAWRDRHYAHFVADAQALQARDNLPRAPFADLLIDGDTTFEHRRLRYALAATDALMRSAAATPPDVVTLRRSINDAATALRATARLLRSRRTVQASATDPAGQSRGVPVRSRRTAQASATDPAGQSRGVPARGNPVYEKLIELEVVGKLLSAFADQFRRAIAEGSIRPPSLVTPEDAVGRWTASLRPCLAAFLSLVREEEARKQMADVVEGAIDADVSEVMATLLGTVASSLATARGVREHMERQAGETLAAYDAFAYQDVFSYPILYGTDFGETDPIEVYRVSPKDATALLDPSKEPHRTKVAGAQFGHFGAFFDRLWRENDILWGRLDGAERLIEALVPEGPHRLENIEVFRRRAFGEILWAELRPEHKGELAGLMAAALARLPVEDRTTKGLLDFVEGQNGGALEPRLKQVLIEAVEHREDLVAYYGTGFDLDTRLQRAPTLRNASRAAHVAGEVLKGVADQRGAKFLLSPLAWLSRIGRLMTGVVEAATPGSFAHILARHWLVLAFLIDFLLIVGGALLGQPAAQHFGWTLLWITVGASVAVAFVGDYLRGRSVWKAILRSLVGLIVIALIGMVALELRHLGGDLGIRTSALSPAPLLPFGKQVHAHPYRYLVWSLGAAFVWFFVVLAQGITLRRPRAKLFQVIPSALLNHRTRPFVKGIVDLEMAGTRDRASEILAAWDAVPATGGRLAARINLGLDVVFIVLYTVALYLAVTWAQHEWRDVWPLLGWIGWFTAFGQVLAGALDAVEDICLWVMLSAKDPGQRLPAFTKRVAELKFLLIGTGIAYFVSGIVRHLVA